MNLMNHMHLIANFAPTAGFNLDYWLFFIDFLKMLFIFRQLKE